MAWSLPFSGQRSIITDAYQRMALTIAVDKLDDQHFLPWFMAVTKENMLHLSIIVNDKYCINTKTTATLDKLNTLAKAIDTIEKSFVPSEDDSSGNSSTVFRPKRIFISIQFSHQAIEFAQSLTTVSFSIDLWLVVVSGDKPTALQNLQAIHNTAAAAQHPSHLGLGGWSDAIELDWYLTKIPHDMLKFVHFGELRLPDLQFHCIELAHTLGYNSMISVTAETLRADNSTSTAVLSDLASQYEVSVETFLYKCLLQLGYVVGVSAEDTSLAHVQQHLSRLCHPFVHRKDFVSSNRVVSLLVRTEHMAVLTDASEQWEARVDDAKWEEHARTRSSSRTLSYHK